MPCDLARYDPILLTSGIDVSWHIEKFAELCKTLNRYTKHCKISFVIESYKGCSSTVHAPTQAQKHQILSSFSKLAKENNIQIEDCAENGDWKEYDILPSKCIDGKIFEKLLTENLKNLISLSNAKTTNLMGNAAIVVVCSRLILAAMTPVATAVIIAMPEKANRKI